MLLGKGYAQDLLYTIDQDNASTWSLLKYDFNTTWHGVKHSFTKPLSWKEKDYLKLGGIIVGTVGLSFADETINDYTENHRSST